MSAPHLVGLIGSRVRGSLSPLLHEHEAAAQGLRYAYRALELDDLGIGAAEAGQTCPALEDVPVSLDEADGLVNATPVGMVGHPGMPFDAAALAPRHWVADIVYRPLETQLVKAARAVGCRVLDGGWMAAAQAADSFELFTGLRADRDRIRADFLQLADAHHD